jgi:hypothetical protein
VKKRGGARAGGWVGIQREREREKKKNRKRDMEREGGDGEMERERRGEEGGRLRTRLSASFRYFSPFDLEKN